MTRHAQRPGDLPSLETLPPDALLMVEEAAAYLGVAPSTLEKWRIGTRGPHSGPPFHRLHGGAKAPVRYRVDDLRNWLASRRVDPAARSETPQNTDAEEGETVTQAA